MKYLLLILLSFAFLGCSQPATGPTTTPAAKTTPEASPTAAATASTATVSFGNLKDGDTVKSPVKVMMVVEGMEVKPAGEDAPNSGHHHIIIDGEPVPNGQLVPADDTHIHFGKGQTETELELAPGEHTLTLQFANYAHQSYGPELSNTIKVTVE